MAQLLCFGYLPTAGKPTSIQLSVMLFLLHNCETKLVFLLEYISMVKVTNWQFNKCLSASKGEASCHVWNLGANAVMQRIKKKKIPELESH